MWSHKLLCLLLVKRGTFTVIIFYHTCGVDSYVGVYRLFPFPLNLWFLSFLLGTVLIKERKQSTTLQCLFEISAVKLKYDGLRIKSSVVVMHFS